MNRPLDRLAVVCCGLVLAVGFAHAQDKPATKPADPKAQQIETLYQEGKQATKAKDWAMAAAKWEEALKIDPQNAEMLNHYAWFLVDTVPPELRKADLALEMATKANELVGGKNKDILDTLAEIAYQKKEYAKAVELSRRSLEPGLQGHANPKGLQRQLVKFEKALADVQATTLPATGPATRGAQ